MKHHDGRHCGCGRGTRHALAAMAGLAAGAGLVYLFDPVGGAGRRTALGGGASTFNPAGAWARVRRRRLSNHFLLARVREAIGRSVSYPASVRASVSDGIVTLRGDVPLHEVDGLLRAVFAAGDVRDITNRLREHREPVRLPAPAGRAGVMASV